METRLSIGEPDATQTRALGPDMALVVTLRSGEQVHARLGVDGQAARARLEQIQRDLAGERFVRIGEGLVLRADEIQSVALAPEHELDRRWQPGAHEGESYPGADPYESGGRLAVVDRFERTMLARVGYLPSSELAATVLGISGVLVAALLTDGLDAGGAWLVVGLIVAAYVVSRGISKAGTEGRRSS